MELEIIQLINEMHRCFVTATFYDIIINSFNHFSAYKLKADKHRTQNNIDNVFSAYNIAFRLSSFYECKLQKKNTSLSSSQSVNLLLSFQWKQFN